jgi:hypothetical protein
MAYLRSVNATASVASMILRPVYASSSNKYCPRLSRRPWTLRFQCSFTRHLRWRPKFTTPTNRVCGAPTLGEEACAIGTILHM